MTAPQSAPEAAPRSGSGAAPQTASPALARTAVRGVAVTTLGQGVRVVVQLLGIVVLARLLDPSDYGIVTMVVAITGVGEVLRDFGLSSAAIQARVLSPQQRSNLFWINTGSGAVLSLLVLGLSWPIAALYGDDRLQPIAAVLAVTFLLNGISTQFRADLNRRMRFGALAVVDISAQCLGLVVAVLAAWAGAGYWALALQQVVAALVQGLVVVVMCRWVPGRPRRGVPMREFLSFGGNLAAVQLLGYASRNVDSVVIGATVGASALGLYNRAFQLMMLPLLQINAPSTRVALPVLSRLRDEPARFGSYLRMGQTMLLTGSGLVLAYSVAQAEDIIRVALGPGWEGVVTPFRILSIAGFAQAAGYSTYWVVLAQGLTRANLRFALVARPLMIVVVAAGGLLGGVVGVASAYALATVLLWPTQLSWLGRRCDLDTRPVLFAGLRTMAVYAAAATASWWVTGALTADLPGGPLVRLAVGALVLLAVLVLSALVLPPYRRDLVEMSSVLRRFRRRRGPQRSSS